MTSTSESPGPALPQMSPSTHVKMTADIATSYLGNNSIAPERVKDVILSIHDALREVHTTASVAARYLVPARSVTGYLTKARDPDVAIA